MKVIRARTAGFCMGVGLALRTLDKALETHVLSGDVPGTPQRIVTFGPIIHNPQVLAHYASGGVLSIESADSIMHGDVVVIRAHGIPRTVEELLRARGAVVLDATCPKVKQAQLAIAEATSAGQTLVLFGEADHPEVQGLVSYAAGAWHIYDSLEALQEDTVVLRRLEAESAAGRSCVLAAQTTQDQGAFASVARWLRERITLAPVLSTICNATRQRQDEAQSIASQVEVMIVVGGKKSGNTRRLAALAQGCGVETWHVEVPEELQLDALKRWRVAGLTAGASTPRATIDAVQEMLEALPTRAEQAER